MAEPIRLKLILEMQDLILETEDGDKKYTLKELTGFDRNKYLNKMSSRAKMGDDGKTLTLKNFDGFQSDLLHISLYNDADEAVSVEEIEAFPASTQQTLFEMSQKLSKLDLDKDSEAKNV